MVAASFQRTHSPSRLAWSEGWRPPGAQSTFIRWPGELSQWLWSWWQHHKHCHGYYYYYYYYYYQRGVRTSPVAKCGLLVLWTCTWTGEASSRWMWTGDLAPSWRRIVTESWQQQSIHCRISSDRLPEITASWWRSTAVERRSLTGELSLSCARPAADGWPLMWVSHPLQVSQLGQLSLSSFLGR